MDETLTTAAVALLAPVPLAHLLSARAKVEQAGRVAFGSRAWELFRKLDQLRLEMPVDVYIYASHADGHRDFAVSWRALYVRCVESETGAHPKGTQYRPDSTASDTNDSAVFWEVKGLQELPEQERISLALFMGLGKKKPYGQAFPPEGPLLIEHP